MPTLCYTHEGFVLFLNELKIQLNKPATKLLAWLMVALLEKTRAHLFRLAEKLPDDTTTDRARQQRIRRFLSNRFICPRLFVPAMVSMVRPLVSVADVLELVIDRTEWMRRGIPVNVLDVGLSYQGRALPLFWTAENRRGNSSICAWQQALAPVIDALRAAAWTQGKTIHVVADREFASPKLSQWLWETYRIGSTLRVKRNEYVQSDDISQTVRAHFDHLRPGHCRFLRQCTVTKDSGFVMNVALWWKKGYDEPWGLMTTHPNLPATVESYRKRFSIEPMHKDWKTNAFDIEGTRVTDAKRIETLLIPIALCYILCMLEGDRKESQGEVIHAHRQKRTTGLFLVGLSAFCRIFRATQLSHLQAFFQRTFTGWLWPERLAQLLKTKSVSY